MFFKKGLHMTLVFLMFFFFISSSTETEVYAADRKASDKNKVRVWFSSEKIRLPVRGMTSSWK